MNNIIAIPARYNSTRLSNKPLQDLGGKPLVLRTLQQAKKVRSADAVFVITDEQKIVDILNPLHKNVILSREEYDSGTDRIAAALAPLKAKHIINLQVDEPFIDPLELDAIFSELKTKATDIVTLRTQIHDAEEIKDPNVVKVVCRDNQEALYFSRAAIPFKQNCLPCGQIWYKHVGVYGYQADALKKYATLSPHPLELSEKLEQLRALAAGLTIKCLDTVGTHLGIDTPEDLNRAKEIVDKLGEKAFP